MQGRGIAWGHVDARELPAEVGYDATLISKWITKEYPMYSGGIGWYIAENWSLVSIVTNRAAISYTEEVKILEDIFIYM